MQLQPWLKNFGVWSAGRSGRRPMAVSCRGVEIAESRLLLSANISLNATTGLVSIAGTALADQATVALTSTGNVQVTFVSGGVTQKETYAAAAVAGIQFDGQAGNDKFTNKTAVASTANGGSGNDSLFGGSQGDRLFGDEGVDSINGFAGNDTVDGGADGDKVKGGNDHDLVSGDAGNDTLEGGLGNDSLDGSDGNDKLLGGGDHDSLHGGSGNDTLDGSTGDDTLLGGDDVDSLIGGEQNDSLEGGNGDDVLSGGNGIDTVKGDAGNDKLTGSAGRDTLEGGDGIDSLFGGNDADLLSGGGGNDSLNGDLGEDTLSGGGDNDTLNGGTGNDLLNGDSGNDSLGGGEQDDILHGGDGADVLKGNFGNDVMIGDADDDQLFGSDGRDLLIGGAGVDRVEGQNGEDILIGGTTSYDNDNAALRSLVTSWAGTATYAVRTAALQASTANPRLQSDETVLHDDQIDSLFGNNDQDWFFLTGSGHAGESSEDDGHSHLGDLPHNLDLMTDRQTTELINTGISHSDNPTLMREHYALFALVDYDLVTHTAIASGSWTDPNVWQNGAVPTAGARVLISANQTVTIDSVLTVSLKTVRVDGTLRFAANVNTELLAETVIVDGKGTFEMGTSAAPIANGVRARLLIDGSQPVDVDEDPFAFGHGLIVHGRATIYGQTVTPFVTLSGAAAAGDTELTLSGTPIGWKVGDQLVIAGTDRMGVTDEVRTILGINGNLVQIAALQFSHAAPQAGLNVHVTNVSRNAVVESSRTELDRRGHIMFMHTRKVDVNYAGLYHLGRTDKSNPANDPVVHDDGHRESGTGSNPRGRYALHFHRNGVTNDANPSKVNGVAVVDSPGWGYVNHSSFVDFTNNVAYDVVGAGFVTEAGDEIGSFIGNLAIRGEGSGEGINDREEIQDFGHQGDGFWFQGAGVRVENNVASGQRGNGFVFFTRGLIQAGLGTTKFSAANLSDPTIAAGKTLIDVGIVPILNFRNNVAYASRRGAATRFHQLNSTHTVRSVIENLTLWNNESGFNIPYTNQTTLRNVTIVGNVNRPEGTGISRNDVTRNIRFENVSVSGYSTGIELPARGQNVVDGGNFNNVRSLVIRTAVGANRSVLITGNVTFGTLTDAALRGRTQQMIVMDANLGPHDGNIMHVFTPDSVTLNFGSFTNRWLYFTEQAASFIPFPTAAEFIPAEYVGKTNQQLKDQFGLSIGGAIAPATATTVPGIVGLL